MTSWNFREVSTCLESHLEKSIYITVWFVLYNRRQSSALVRREHYVLDLPLWLIPSQDIVPRQHIHSLEQMWTQFIRIITQRKRGSQNE